MPRRAIPPVNPAFFLMMDGLTDLTGLLPLSRQIQCYDSWGGCIGRYSVDQFPSRVVLVVRRSLVAFGTVPIQSLSDE